MSARPHFSPISNSVTQICPKYPGGVTLWGGQTKPAAWAQRSSITSSNLTPTAYVCSSLLSPFFFSLTIYGIFILNSRQVPAWTLVPARVLTKVTPPESAQVITIWLRHEGKGSTPLWKFQFLSILLTENHHDAEPSLTANQIPSWYNMWKILESKVVFQFCVWLLFVKIKVVFQYFRIFQNISGPTKYIFNIHDFSRISCWWKHRWTHSDAGPLLTFPLISQRPCRQMSCKHLTKAETCSFNTLCVYGGLTHHRTVMNFRVNHITQTHGHTGPAALRRAHHLLWVTP